MDRFCNTILQPKKSLTLFCFSFVFDVLQFFFWSRRYSAVASINFPIHVLSIGTSQVTCVVNPSSPFVYAMTAVNGGRWLVCSHGDSKIAVYDISSGATGSLIRAWPAVRNNAGNFSITALPYEQGIVSCGSRERVVKVWSNDGQLLRVLGPASFISNAKACA